MLLQLIELVQNYPPKTFGSALRTRLKLKTFVSNFMEQNNCKNINEAIYCIINAIIPPKCMCGQKLLFNTYIKGYRTVCKNKECKNINQKNKMTDFWRDNDAAKAGMIAAHKKTCLEKYKVTNVALDPTIKAKIKKTNNIRYGADTPLQSKQIINKIKQKNIDNLGVEYPFQSAVIRDKANTTYFVNHNEENNMQIPRKVWNDNNNNTNPFAIVRIQEKIKKYWNDNFHVDHPMQVPEILNRAIESYQIRYNRNNASQLNIPEKAWNLINDKEQLAKILLIRSLVDIAEEYEIRPELLISYHNKHDLDILDLKGRSIIEDEIEKILIEHGIKFKKNDRTICKPFELDFVLYEHNIAIEYNGLFYHSEYWGQKDSKFHEYKTKTCRKQNIQLLTIFADEWEDRKITIVNHILHLCNKTTKVVGARKLSFNEVDFSTFTTFLEDHHIQGSVNASIRMGIFNNNEMVGVFGLKKVSNSEYNLVRYAINPDASYPGLMSKFLKYIKFNYSNIKEIITFADLRWSYGDVYVKTGFITDYEIPPDYQYTDYKHRYHKTNFRKDKIAKKFNVDINNKTEEELMKDLGYDRIWDCGKIKFRKIL